MSGTDQLKQQPKQPVAPEGREAQPSAPRSSPEQPATAERQKNRTAREEIDRQREQQDQRDIEEKIKQETEPPPPAQQPQTPRTALNKSAMEKIVNNLSKIGEGLSSALDSMQKMLGKILAPLVPALQRFGIVIPEWLQPQGLAMKELYAALGANKRTLEQTPDDDKNMREVIKTFSDMQTQLVKKDGVTLEKFISDVVAQADSDKEKLTTADIKTGAGEVARKMLEQDKKAQPAPAGVPPASATV